jgi:RNA polymerase sigma-70 factor (ECF subfamily)
MGDLAPDSSETQTLLERARAGDRRSFDRLFGLHAAYLRRVVVLRLDPRVRGRVDPSDVLQDTQLEALRRLPDYLDRRPMPFRLWLRKTAHERLLVAHRQHVGAARRAVGREVPLPDRSSVDLGRRLLAAGPAPGEELDRQDLARRVRRAVAQLPEADREVLLMRAFEGLSNQDVAAVLGIDSGTASKRHGRALLRLHRLLSDDGLTGSHV